METVYIVTIVCGSLFFVLFVAFIVTYIVNTKRMMRQIETLQKMYSDANIAKMEYDIGVYDGDVEKFILSRNDPEGQMTIDDVINPDAEESSGVEEITGNYKP